MKVPVKDAAQKPEKKKRHKGDETINEKAESENEKKVEPDQEKPDAADDTKPETVEELTDHLKRLAAEFENYKKRTNKEIVESQNWGAARIMTALLPVIDSFDRSLANSAGNQDAEKWQEGMGKIYRQLVDEMAKLGLKEVRPEIGEKLDPSLHEVLMAMPMEGMEPDTIAGVLLAGYQLKDRLLRPAQVQVAVAPPAVDEEQGGDENE